MANSSDPYAKTGRIFAGSEETEFKYWIITTSISADNEINAWYLYNASTGKGIIFAEPYYQNVRAYGYPKYCPEDFLSIDKYIRIQANVHTHLDYNPPSYKDVQLHYGYTYNRYVITYGGREIIQYYNSENPINMPRYDINYSLWNY
ncbi:MAG: hypothetical protein HY738_22355 [Bacteroidia bacterium]|nr:hypothetical protein [Bacteroidia bacterium]